MRQLQISVEHMILHISFIEIFVPLAFEVVFIYKQT